MIIGNDGRPMHVPGGRAGRDARRDDGRPAWGGGGGGAGRRDRERSGGGGGGDYYGYARREPEWEYSHRRSAAINRLAVPKRDYSDERVEQRPAWAARGGDTVRRRPPGFRPLRPGGYHAPEPEPRFRGGTKQRVSNVSQKFPPLQRVHGMSRLDALRQQQEVQQEQLRYASEPPFFSPSCPGVPHRLFSGIPCAFAALISCFCALRELREQQREQQRQLAMQQEAELEELHSMQAWQQQLQEKLANLEEQTMLTAEAILEEIEDARADVRNVTLKSLRELTTKRRQELQQQQHHRSSSPNGRSAFPKRPSPVFTPDDDNLDRAPSPASARTRRAVRKVRPDGLQDGATLQERRKWVEEIETATLEASMDDLMEEVHNLRKDVDAGVSGKSSPQRQRQSSTDPASGRRPPESRTGGRDDVKSPPVAVLPQDRGYKSPPRAKGSIIGELRRAGLSIALPGQAKSTANSRVHDVAPPALRSGTINEEARSHGGKSSPKKQDGHRRSRSKSPHRRSEADEIAAAVEEEERRELEALQQQAADKLYAEVQDALCEPWVEKGAGEVNDRNSRRHQALNTKHEEPVARRGAGDRSVAREDRETQRGKKPRGQIRSVSSRRDRYEGGEGESQHHSPKHRVSKLPSLAAVSESIEEEGEEDDDRPEELRIKRALAAGNVDEVRAVLAKSSGSGGGGQILATSGRGEKQLLLQRQDSSVSHSGSDTASSPMQPSPDPEKMRQLQKEAITHKEYVEMSLRDTGWSKSEPEPSYMRPVEKKKKKNQMDSRYDVTHVQEVLSRSSKLRMLRDQKAAAKRSRRAEAQDAAEHAAVSYVRAATG